MQHPNGFEKITDTHRLAAQVILAAVDGVRLNQEEKKNVFFKTALRRGNLLPPEHSSGTATRFMSVKFKYKKCFCAG